MGKSSRTYPRQGTRKHVLRRRGGAPEPGEEPHRSRTRRRNSPSTSSTSVQRIPAHIVTSPEIAETTLKGNASRHVLKDIILSKSKYMTEKPSLHLVTDSIVPEDGERVAQLVSAIDCQPHGASLGVKQHSSHPMDGTDIGLQIPKLRSVN